MQRVRAPIAQVQHCRAIHAFQVPRYCNKLTRLDVALGGEKRFGIIASNDITETMQKYIVLT